MTPNDRQETTAAARSREIEDATSQAIPVESEIVARIDLYEHRVRVDKEPVIGERVNIKKVADLRTVELAETVRRERLSVDAQGQPNVRQ